MQISSFSALASTARTTVKALAAAVADAETEAAKKNEQERPGTDVAVAGKTAKAVAKSEVRVEARPMTKDDDAKATPKKGGRKGTVLDAYA